MALHDLLKDEMEARDREREQEIKKWEEEEKEFYKKNYDEHGPLIETEVKMTWVPTKNSLPDVREGHTVSERVLLKPIGSNGYIVGEYDKEKDLFINVCGGRPFYKGEISHWAKINFPKRRYY